MNKNIPTVLGITITAVLAVAVIGIIVSQYYSREQVGIEEEAEIVEDKTKNWETYINQYFGFEIKYPPNYEADGSTEAESKEFKEFLNKYIQSEGDSYKKTIVIIDKMDTSPEIEQQHPGLFINITGYRQKLENIEDLKEILLSKGEAFTEKTINNTKWLIISEIHPSLPYSKMMYTLKDNLEFLMIVKDSPLDKPIIEEIISSFRSIDFSQFQEVYRVTIDIKEDVPLAPTEEEPYPKFRLLAENYIGFYPFSFSSEEVISRKIVYDKKGMLRPAGLPVVDEKRRDFSYYIFATSYQPIKTEEKYEDENVVITVEKEDKSLIPYIKDRNYCEVNEDCNIGYNLCAYGAFNRFEEWFIGCEYPIYPQENWDELNKICDRTKEIPIVKYENAECLENKCVAKGRTVTCQEGTLP